MTTESDSQQFSFQAEVQQLLDIVIHSLYTDREIFVRELVSNASDALEKLRHLQITEKEIFDSKLPLEISVSTDENGGVVTIQDFGLGMTRDELVENLGTIAHSGSRAFLKALSEGGEKNGNLIGRFGVGFYSVFMVAKRVRVFARSWRLDEQGYCWTSEGNGVYEIEPVEGQRRGCKVVIELRDEHKEFAKESRVRSILNHYSSFVQFPILLNGEQTNKIRPLWLRGKNEATEEEYEEFYKFFCKAFDKPRFRLHFSADAPLAIHCLLFVPQENREKFGMGRLEPAVALYCRKILIDSGPKELLPDWLRFLGGVIDSEDLPLNISRETMQDSALVQKLNRLITKRFLKFLEEEANRSPQDYESFFKEFGYFLKEGIATDFTHKEQLAKLIRFESSLTESGKFTSLADYVSRMKEDQKAIYYLAAPSREALENGPYLEAFKLRNLEVLFLYDAVDEFVMSSLIEFDGKKLISADEDDLELQEIPPPAGEEPLPEEEIKKLCLWLRDSLGDRVAEVSGSSRLVESPALVLNADKMMSPTMRRMMKAMNREMDSRVRVNLQINPRHQLVKNIATLRESDEKLAKLVAEQVFDNAMIAAGLLEDARPMVSRIQQLLETVAARKT
jgi:TNF receptor-associated protein 1